jgi:hypothetical protein
VNEIQAIPATPAQAAELKRAAGELEAKSRQIAAVVMQRLAWWQAVQNVAGQYDLDLRSLLGDRVVKLNEEADKGAMNLLVWLFALDTGAAEIVGVQGTGNTITMGVIRRGVITGNTGFPVLAYVVIGTLASLAALGMWTIHAGFDAEQLRARAQLAHEANTARKLEIVAKAQATGQLDKVEPILAQIDAADAKAQKSITDSVSSSVASMASGIVDTVTTGGIGLGVIALLAWWLLGRRSRA